jgi:2-polyprenyl-6-hydroxyphenyl methylase/3-demethylubiquinone-9 3-methyltransferase
MREYYENKLSAEGLRKCYEIAPPRICQYLDAEVRFVTGRIMGKNQVLELGCGYGRVMRQVSTCVGSITGCDTSRSSLELAKSHLLPHRNFGLVLTDASCLAFRSGVFDAVFCVQNGISAFGVSRQRLVDEAVRVTRKGGLVLFSSYSHRIWKHRLAWFKAQSEAGLVGEIDETRTGKGTIVCKDGFHTTTVSRAEFERLFSKSGAEFLLKEVDGSSLFCLARK